MLASRTLTKPNIPVYRVRKEDKSVHLPTCLSVYLSSNGQNLVLWIHNGIFRENFYLGFFFLKKVLLSHPINYQSDIYEVWKKNSSFKDIWGLPINNIFMYQSEQAIVVKY